MEMMEAENEDSHHHDITNSDDDDSDYTYVTDDDEEDEEADDTTNNDKKNGWFDFLIRRERKNNHVTTIIANDDDDDDDEEDDDEGSYNNDDNSGGGAVVDDDDSDHHDVKNGTTAANNKKDDCHLVTTTKTTTSSDDDDEEEDILDQIDNYNPSNSTSLSLQLSSLSSTNQPYNNDNEEEEESILMAQAIQRVQQRIQSHGGNFINNALEKQRDEVLVDTLLRGGVVQNNNEDNVIRGVVDRAMKEEEEDEEEKKKKKTTMEYQVGQGDNDGGGGDKMVVENNNKDHHYVVNRDEEEEEDITTTINESSNTMRNDGRTTNTNNGNSIKNGGSEDDDDVKMVEKVNRNVQGDDDDDDDDDDEEEEYPQEEEEEGEDDDEDDDDDDEEEEGPTLEEQRSLLSLAAEHDRVDVIKELLSISQNEDANTSLLCGFTSANEGNDATKNNDDNNVIFVPPPLHAAVAHGSVNAASCLLRMGADPSLRPIVPSPYLSRKYQPSSSSSPSSTQRRKLSMEEDRNYKKYHDMSAWELAFGSIVVLENGDDIDAEEEEKEEEEDVGVTKKRGWFGFGGGHHHKKDEDEVVVTIQQQDSNGKQRIVRRRQPLNIAPNKLEGIRHAFTAEALRAIGADEVDRLKQLLDSGMDSEMEVAGKTLVSWAVEMEANGCCKLLRVDDIKMGEEDVSSPDDLDGGRSPVMVTNSTSNGMAHTTPSTKPANGDQSTAVSQKSIAAIHDERLAGLSHKDILTLIQENENLIPALTTCRDELAEEASACQNILRDIQASGGRGGLSSKSLLDLVHSLKERRRDLEEGVKNWQHAWEEREDELDFFWEEVLNDEWREHLAQSGVLDNLSDTLSAPTLPRYANASIADLTRRFCEVDNRVKNLRSSIASLAEECARYQAEVQRAGMSGALSLTKSLREELKEMESQLSEAKSGEAMCRRKIELIQERLNNSARDEPVQEHVQNNDCVDAEEHRYESNDSPPAGQGQKDVSNVTYDFVEKELMEGTAYAEAFMRRGMERECFLDEYEEDDRNASKVCAASYECDHDVSESVENKAAVLDEGEEQSGFVVVNDSNEVTSETDENVPVEKQGGANVVKNDDEDVTIPSEMQEIEAVTDTRHSDNGQSHKIGTAVCEQKEKTASNDLFNAPIRAPDSALDTLKPSDALQSGMSTALVVRQPTGRPGLSLQIWDLIRRIVGLGRTSSYRTQSESSTNIMIV